jgi:hypothetical protein
LRVGQWPFRDPLCQRHTVDELEDQGLASVGFLQAINRRNVQRGKRLGFPREARQAIGIAGEFIGEQFQRDITIQLAVACAE